MVRKLGHVLACGAVVLAFATCAEATSVPPREDAYWDVWPWMTTRIAGPAQLIGALAEDSMTSRVIVTLAVVNIGGTSAQLEHGACSFGLRLYRSAEPASLPAWDNRPPSGSSCILPLYQVTVPPGTRHEQRLGELSPATLGDSLAAGRYRASIVLRFPDEGIRLIPAGVVDVPARTGR